jgi:SAM-dependent methyltransferase
MKQLEYQKDLSVHSPILLDAAYKRAKVDKMLSILVDCGAISQTHKKLALDIGCSRGFFAAALAPYFEGVIGIDIDMHALRLAKIETPSDSVHYLLGDSLRIPLPDRSVDLIICNHVYEHVPDAERLFTEIYRVLKNTGVCYLGAASRLTFVEPHYHLPFLSWLPKPLAHLYMRFAGKGSHYYENLRTIWGIRRLISRFDVLDYTLKVVENPDRFHARDLFPRGGVLEKIPMWAWRFSYVLLPSYLFILKRRLDTQ